jgi:Na+/phosphate symporter
MWPLVNKLVLWLSGSFKTLDDDHPRYLDNNSLAIPSLAIHALYKKLQRVGHYSLATAKDSINFKTTSNNMTVKYSVV